MVFDSVSPNIDEVLSISPSANVFVFGDFNVHHKDWLSYFGGTDIPVNSVSKDLTQMVNFPTWIPDCDSHSPALLDLFISSDASTMAFPPLEIPIMLFSQFPLTFHQIHNHMPCFHCIAHDYSHADWDGLHNHLRDVPWEDIFKLSASVAASEFCEWVQVGTDLYTLHHTYQVKPHTSS